MGDKLVEYISEWAAFALTLLGIYKFLDKKLVGPAKDLKLQLDAHESANRSEFTVLQDGFQKAERTMQRIENRQGEHQRQLDRLEKVMEVHTEAIISIKTDLRAHELGASIMREDVQEVKEDVKSLLSRRGTR